MCPAELGSGARQRSMLLFMKAKWHFGILLTCVAGLSLPAFSQIDRAKFTSDLRTKYDPPISTETVPSRTGNLVREIFTGWHGIQMIVDFAANGQACRIQLRPAESKQVPGRSTTQALVDLLPPALRGKQLGGSFACAGANCVSTAEYDDVTIAEWGHAGETSRGEVTFKKEECSLR
jgi:hypothetical protein